MRNPNPTIKPPFGSYIDWGHPLAEGLVRCFLFNEHAGQVVNDLSPCEKNGKNDGAFWGDGLYFDGSSSEIDCGKGKSLILTDMTLVARINPAVDLASQPDYVAFIDKSRSWSLTTWSDGTVIMQTYYGDGSNWVRTTSTTIPVANTWYDLSGVADGTNIKIYVDEVKEGTTALPDSIYNKADAITTIGNDTDAPSRYFNGLIDRSFIYKRALSSDENKWLKAEPYCFIIWPGHRFIFDYGHLTTNTQRNK